MKRTAINSLLFVTVVALLSMNWVLIPDPNKRNVEVLPDMARSVPYDSFAPNANFADNMTLRAPVPGTVIRGFTPAPATNPFAPTDAKALARGAAVYATYCEICHGPGGKGDGTVAQRGFPTPPSLLAPKARGLADAQIFGIITKGQNNMPPYAAQIDRDDRWRAILHVRALQQRGSR